MEKFKKLDNFTLKIIALVTMLVDHIGTFLYPENNIFREIGRISFPIFAFLVAQGFYYTYKKGKFKKYFLTMLSFSVATEILLQIFNNTPYFKHLNVLLTYTLSLLCLYIWEKMNEKDTVLSLVIILIITCIAGFINVDYSFFGVLFVFCIYLYIKEKKLFFLVISFVAILIANYPYITGTIISILPIILYSGKQGMHNKVEKYFFYVFYPLHLIILMILCQKFFL